MFELVAAVDATSERITIVRDVLQFMTVVIGAYFAYKLNVLTKQGANAATAVTKVAETIVEDKKNTKEQLQSVAEALSTATTVQDTKLNEMALIGEKVHTLVNNAMGQKLLELAQSKRQILDLLKASNAAPEIIGRAENDAAVANSALGEHERKQKVVDRATGIEALRRAQEPLPPTE